MSFSKSTLLVLMAALAVGGCGGKGGGADAGGGNGGPGSQPGKSVSCPDAWSRYVAANPQGHSEESSTEVKVNTAGHEFVISSDTENRTVEQSGQDQVVIKIATRHSTNTLTITRDEFMKSCGANPGTAAPQSGYTVEVLAQGRQSVDVPAGHFDCLYTKIRMHATGAGPERPDIVTETWVEGQDAYGMIIKSVSTMETTDHGGRKSVQTTTRVLVSRS